ncbi:MAG: exonuclease domain-containing protein [Succinivibrio sp.]
MTDNNLMQQLKYRFREFLPVIVDVETAGFDPKVNALIEVSMMTVKFDENGYLIPDEQFSANIRPFEGSVINESNIAFLKIDPFDESRDLKTEEEALLPMFKSISKKIKQHKCKRAVLVGHNGHFDLGFILAAAERLKTKKCPFHPFSVIDTGSLSMLMYGQSVLVKACLAAGIGFDMENAHGAAYDTRKECELFCAIYNRFTRFIGLPEPMDVEIDYNSGTIVNNTSDENSSKDS